MLKNWLQAARSSYSHFASAYATRAPIVFLDQRWGHHGRHSGYLASTGIGPTIPRHDRIVPHPLMRYWADRTRDDEWEQRWLMHLYLTLGHAKVLHVIDGDFDAWIYNARPRFSSTRISATFHQTVDKLPELAAALRPGMLDAIVCVSRNQVPLLEAYVPRGRCVFIPHGVDTDFFTPGPSLPEDAAPVLLAVGAHRRDFATLIEAARLIKTKKPNVIVRLIGPADKISEVARDGTVETRSGVSDEELRDAYRSSTMLFLPLEEATANNALLESMACGKPAVITDLPALHDYTAADAAIFCPRGNARAHADAALRLLDDAGLRDRMGRAAFERSRTFTWHKVRYTLDTFLQTVMDR